MFLIWPFDWVKRLAFCLKGYVRSILRRGTGARHLQQRVSVFRGWLEAFLLPRSPKACDLAAQMDRFPVILGRSMLLGCHALVGPKRFGLRSKTLLGSSRGGMRERAHLLFYPALVGLRLRSGCQTIYSGPRFRTKDSSTLSACWGHVRTRLPNLSIGANRPTMGKLFPVWH